MNFEPVPRSPGSWPRGYLEEAFQAENSTSGISEERQGAREAGVGQGVEEEVSEVRELTNGSLGPVCPSLGVPPRPSPLSPFTWSFVRITVHHWAWHLDIPHGALRTSRGRQVPVPERPSKPALARLGVT